MHIFVKKPQNIGAVIYRYSVVLGPVKYANGQKTYGVTEASMPRYSRRVRGNSKGYYTCPNCGLQAAFTKNTVTIKKKPSKRRQAAGRRIASTLPRDPVTGRFLPRGTVGDIAIPAPRRGRTRKRKGKERVSSRSQSRARFEEFLFGEGEEF